MKISPDTTLVLSIVPRIGLALSGFMIFFGIAFFFQTNSKTLTGQIGFPLGILTVVASFLPLKSLRLPFGKIVWIVSLIASLAHTTAILGSKEFINADLAVTNSISIILLFLLAHTQSQNEE